MKYIESDYLKLINSEWIPWEKLRSSNILITGATGLIGSTLVNVLLFANERLSLNTNIFCVVRSKEKAKKVFSEKIKKINLIESNIENIDEKICSYNIDYIIHSANPTSSLYFINNPVDTWISSFIGTEKLLKLANTNNVKGMIYLSTMEVYGHPEKGIKATEKDVSSFLPEIPRNCYPLSKIACESLCLSYHSQYKLPINVLRLTQTFGPGIAEDDNRVFAEFIRNAITKKDIILKTKGETERCYLYTVDAVSAILVALLSETMGSCFTVANESTYCSIYEMASLVANEISEGKIKVVIQEDDISKYGYASVLYMDLDTSKIKSLGWQPYTSLKEMYENTIKCFC